MVGQENHARPWTLTPSNRAGSRNVKEDRATPPCFNHPLSFLTPNRNRPTTRARENEEEGGRGKDSSKRENRNNKRFSPFSIDVSFRRDTRPWRATYNKRRKSYRREGERKKKGALFYPEGSTRLRNGAPYRGISSRLPRFNKHIAKLYDYERSRKRPAPCTDHLYFQLDPRWWIGRPLS